MKESKRRVEKLEDERKKKVIIKNHDYVEQLLRDKYRLNEGKSERKEENK